jgi:hypothetical protein
MDGAAAPQEMPNERFVYYKKPRSLEEQSRRDEHETITSRISMTHPESTGLEPIVRIVIGF